MTCSILDCKSVAIKRGWCGLHYQRWRKHGDPLKTIYAPPGQRPPCEIKECNQLAVCHGWCHKHDTRWRTHGDPNKVAKRRYNLPRKPSEIKQMTELEAAQVGRMIDTDGWIGQWGRKTSLSWVVGFYAKTIPALADDLLKLTGGGRVRPDARNAQGWYIQRFLSVLDLVRQIAPWSYKARAILPKLEQIASSFPDHRSR